MYQRVLSLDGGGTWALLQVRTLQALYGERATGAAVLAPFSYAIGCSGGGLVLAALCAGMRLDQIAEAFTDPALLGGLFHPRWWPLPPRYSTERKRDVLRSLLGDAATLPLANLSRTGIATRVLFPAFDANRRRTTFLRSYTPPLLGAAFTGTLLDAAHATSTPPVLYFDAPVTVGDRALWDGALGGFNNPVLAGVLEPLSAGVAPERIHALSLGTGTVAAPPPSDSLWGATNLLATVILDDPPDAASWVAHVVLGGRAVQGPVVRLSPLLETHANPEGLTVEQCGVLRSCGLDARTPDALAAIEALGASWRAGHTPNQPLREVVGSPSFLAGIDAWRRLSALES